MNKKLDELAEVIHKARWPKDRQMDITSFADEDRSGREYCFRIARAVMTWFSEETMERLNELIALVDQVDTIDQLDAKLNPERKSK